MFDVSSTLAAGSNTSVLEPLLVLSIEGFPYLLTQGVTGLANELPFISQIDDWSVGVDELNGSYTIDDLNVTAVDSRGLLTQLFHATNVLQSKCTLRLGLVGMAIGDYATLFTGIVGSISRHPDATFSIVCQDPNRLSQRVVYTKGDTYTVTTTVTTYNGQYYTVTATAVTTNRSTGSTSTVVTSNNYLNGSVGTVTSTDDAAISSTNTRRLVGHPLDILVNTLVEEVGFSLSGLNVAQIQQYRDEVLAGVEYDFTLDSAVDAKDFIENQLLKPLGGYIYPNNLGLLCVGFLQPASERLAAVMDLNDQNMQDVPDVVPQDLTNVVTFRFDKDSGSDSSTGYLAESNNFYSPSISDLDDLTGQVAQSEAQGSGAVQGQSIIESDGMRSGFQGFLLAKMVSNSIFAKYGNYNPVLDIAAHWFPAFRLEVADFVTITHPLVVDLRYGAPLSAARYQVIKRGYSFGSNMTVSLAVNDASGIRTFSAHRIAPNGTGAYTSVDTATQSRYIFLSGKDGKQSNGDAAATLG
jgi:hypothetical protein